MKFFFLFEVALAFVVAIYSFLYSVTSKQPSFLTNRVFLKKQRSQSCDRLETKIDGLVGDEKYVEKGLDQTSDIENTLETSCVLWATPDFLHSVNEQRPINSKVPFRVETELFDGIAQLWINGMQSTPPELFAGKKRKSWFVVQGKFKKLLLFDEVLTGQEFEKPLVQLPGGMIFGALLRMARTFNPSSQHRLKPHPSFLTNLLATAQVINVAVAGTEPLLTDPVEDMRLVGDCFAAANGEPLSSLQRKKLMSCSRNRKALAFDQNHVWTFHFWQHFLDLTSFDLNLRVKRFSLQHHLNGQPLRLMAKHQDGTILWNFDLYPRHPSPTQRL